MRRIEIVAECGVNWAGDIGLAKEMIKRSKEAGADAVKFQVFSREVIAGSPHEAALSEMILNRDRCLELMEYARSVGIEWFATAMYPAAVEMLVSIGVKRIKIRERDSTNRALIEKAIQTGLDVLVSTQDPSRVAATEPHQVKLLYCVPLYPPRLEDIDFTRMNQFYGYSNHSPEISVPLAAAVLGSRLLEVHVTPDHDMDNLDKPVSIDFSELSELVRMVRAVERLKLHG